MGDATALPGLLDKVPNRVKRPTADGGYDRREVYEAARKRGARTVIPPRRDATVSGDPVLCDRDAHLERIGEVGRRRWRLEVGNEVLTACNILNKMAELGMPCSIALRG